MASESVDLGTANGVFKDRYPSKIADAIPDFCYLQKPSMVEFVPVEKDAMIGNKYRVPVTVRRPQGFTYNKDGSAFALNESRAMRQTPAEVTGAIVALEERVSVIADSRGKSKEQAVALIWDTVVSNMDLSIKARQEFDLLYGGDGLMKTLSSGTAATAAAVISGSAYDGAITHASTNDNFTTISINPLTWSSIVTVAEGAGLQFYFSGSQIGVQVFDLIAYDSLNKTITVAGTGANIATLVTSINTPNVNDIFFEGQRTLSMTGLSTIASNTGTLFNLNGAIWSVWKGNTFDLASNPLNVGVWTQAMGRLQSRGLSGAATMLVSPAGWADFLSDITALREIDQSYKNTEVDMGHQVITLFSQNGRTRIVSHPFVKDGDFFIYPDDSLMRVGSTDVSFKSREGDDNFIYKLPSNFGYGLRAFFDLALFCTKPSHLMKGINRVSAV